MQIKQGIVFTSFKYTMYALLFINTISFYAINSASEQITNHEGLALGEIIVAYADAIDSASWLLLLLLFEFETSFDPPEKHEFWIQPLIGAATIACWVVIVYSFYGYVGGLDMLGDFAAYAGPDPCSLNDAGALFVASLDDYIPLDPSHCAAMASGALYSAELNMYATPDSFALLKRLIWIDVINAGAWIIVAGIIEFEIFLRVTRGVSPEFLRIANIVKFPFWMILVGATILWWIYGTFLDAWDAFLWIAAFFFIELNMIAKHEERAKKRSARNSPEV